MDETRIRAIIREEIDRAFQAMSVAANGLDMPYETSELDSRALTNIGQAADRAAHEFKELCETADEERAQDAENPFAPDTTMSREAADFILRAMNGLLLEGYWPKAYAVDGRHGGEDEPEYDNALLRRAADIIGRDKIRNTDLLRFLSELDAAGE
jgi:hypothetical protein